MEEQETGAAQLKLLLLFDILYKKQTERRGVATNRCSVREERFLVRSPSRPRSTGRNGEGPRNLIKSRKGQSIIV